jgi:steroid delta-isomerase-like uncharacterized protein
MTPQEMKDIARRGAAECWHWRNMDALDDILSPDYQVYVGGKLMYSGRDAMKTQVQQAQAAFPDVNVSVEDLIAEGDRVVARFTFRGTHTGTYHMDMGDMPPTGRKVEVTGIIIFRFEDGKIIENREVLDNFGMLQQLGIIPTPGQAPDGASGATSEA